MIALRSSGAGVTDGAREAHHGDTFRPSAYDSRRFLRARRRRGARFVAYRVAQIVAAADRFLFKDRPARERFLTAVAIGLSASVLVIMFSAALRGAVARPWGDSSWLGSAQSTQTCGPTTACRAFRP